MTSNYKLTHRLALVRGMLAAPLAVAVGCEMGQGCAARDAASGSLQVDTVFTEDFESGTLAAWPDGVDHTRQRIVTDPSFAQSGSHYLEVTYVAGGDGGWLTRFFMPGYDSRELLRPLRRELAGRHQADCVLRLPDRRSVVGPRQGRDLPKRDGFLRGDAGHGADG